MGRRGVGDLRRDGLEPWRRTALRRVDVEKQVLAGGERLAARRRARACGRDADASRLRRAPASRPRAARVPPTSCRCRMCVSTVYALARRAGTRHRRRHGGGRRPSLRRRRGGSAPPSCGRCSRPRTDRRRSRTAGAADSGRMQHRRSAALANRRRSCSRRTAPAPYARARAARAGARRGCRRGSARARGPRARPPARPTARRSCRSARPVSSGTSVSFVHGHPSAGPNCSRKWRMPSLAACDPVRQERAHLRPAQAGAEADRIVHLLDRRDVVVHEPQRLAPERLEQAVGDEAVDLLADEERLHSERRVEVERAGDGVSPTSARLRRPRRAAGGTPG